jgi:hypothetical protein
MRPSKCARITSLKVHFYKQNRRLLSSRYALFDGRLSNKTSDKAVTVRVSMWFSPSP